MKRLGIFAGVVLVVLIGLVIWWQWALLPVNPSETENKTFVIDQGEGIRPIALRLQKQGLIRDQIAFFILIKKLGLEKDIQAGSFKLAPNLSAEALAKKLTLGTVDHWITIPEGWRSEEVLEYLRNQTIDNGHWTIEEENKKWKMDEGKLFPDTYLVSKQATIDSIHQLMRATFDQKMVTKLRDDALPNTGLTFDQVMILASLVEREVRTDVNRAKVADVLLKRLKDGMALDVDASVQYALSKQKGDGWWKKELILEDLKIDSPYNTYKNPGLPPRPICNPGLSSIRAVVYHEANPYYFYITDKEGNIHYAKTLEEHNANIAKYLP